MSRDAESPRFHHTNNQKQPPTHWLVATECQAPIQQLWTHLNQVCACGFPLRLTPFDFLLYLIMLNRFFLLEWVLWEHKSTQPAANTSSNTKNASSNEWKENMSELCSFKTVQEFWHYYAHLPRPSEIFFDGESKKKVNSVEQKTIEEYSLFKRGIEPEWSDPQNVIGGEWFFRQYLDSDVLDLYWMNLVLGVIGEVIEHGSQQLVAQQLSKGQKSPENFSYSPCINGIRVLDKSRGTMPLFKIEIWVNTREERMKLALREKLSEVMMDTSNAPSGAGSTTPTARRKGSPQQPKFEWKDHAKV
jgi:translation initiation factor 4E